MYVGECEKRRCEVAKSAPNNIIAITGISGSGKTCKMNKVELWEVERGRTVLVVDMGKTHAIDEIFKDIYVEYNKYMNHIYAVEDGLKINLLRPICNKNGKEEPYLNLVNSAVQTLSASQSMGIKQKGVLREAVIKAIEYQKGKPNMSEAEALISVFRRENKGTSGVVYQRLWSLLNSNVLNPNGRCIEAGKINIIDLSELDSMTREVVGEIILSWVWRTVYYSGLPKDFGSLTVVLDEFQHFSLKKDAVLRDILREGRKFKLNLILGTQTFEAFPRETLGLLNQASTHLYFHPPLQEASKLAKMINPAQADYWRARLLGLQVGECIATGELEVNGQRITRPLVLT